MNCLFRMHINYINANISQIRHFYSDTARLNLKRHRVRSRGLLLYDYYNSEVDLSEEESLQRLHPRWYFIPTGATMFRRFWKFRRGNRFLGNYAQTGWFASEVIRENTARVRHIIIQDKQLDIPDNRSFTWY